MKKNTLTALLGATVLGLMLGASAAYACDGHDKPSVKSGSDDKATEGKKADEGKKAEEGKKDAKKGAPTVAPK
jgi:hypothetical protein